MLKAAAKAVKDKADKTWTLTKKIVGLLSVWGLIFSLVTIGELKVAFDYDDTLVFSTPAYAKGFAGGVQPYSPQFWRIVNSHYDLERPKPLPYAMAWVFRVLGFKVTVITSRPNYGGDALRKEWRMLATNFIFSGGSDNKHKYLRDGNYVMCFGDSDVDIIQGRKAGVLTFRVKRSPKSLYKDDYHPGTLREIVIPLTQF
ncbi:MAG: hypothetical protein ABIJ96_11815 [Elusimicrobiota bacterium]